MFTYKNDDSNKLTKFSPVSISDLQSMCSGKGFLLTDKSIVELTSIDQDYLGKVLRDLKIPAIHNSSFRNPTKLFENIDTSFYASEDIVLVCKHITDPKKVIKTPLLANSKRYAVGLNIAHPEGKVGAARSLGIFREECQKLMQPTPPALTYDTLDYNQLNWRHVLSHQNFDALMSLVDCPNNTYLRQYMSTDTPSDQQLAELSEKALKHRRRTSNLPQEDEQPSPEFQAPVTPSITTPPTAPAQQPEKIKDFKTVYQVIENFMEVENSLEDSVFANYATMLRTLYKSKGGRPKPKLILEELHLAEKVLNYLPSNCDYSAQTYLEPKDLAYLSGADTRGVYKIAATAETPETTLKLSEILDNFMRLHTTTSYRAASECDTLVPTNTNLAIADGRPVFMSTNIAKAVALLRAYITSIVANPSELDTPN